MSQKPQSFTRAAMAREVAKSHEMSLAEAKAVVNTVVEAARSAVEEGRKVAIAGLVTLTPKHQGKRRYRNPSTGEYFIADPKMVVKAKVSPVLAAKVAEIEVVR